MTCSKDCRQICLYRASLSTGWLPCRLWPPRAAPLRLSCSGRDRLGISFYELQDMLASQLSVGGYSEARNQLIGKDLITLTARFSRSSPFRTNRFPAKKFCSRPEMTWKEAIRPPLSRYVLSLRREAMMDRRLIFEIYRLKDLGLTVRGIARSLKIGRKTVAKYLNKPQPRKKPDIQRASKLDPFKDEIAKMLISIPK